MLMDLLDVSLESWTTYNAHRTKSLAHLGTARIEAGVFSAKHSVGDIISFKNATEIRVVALLRVLPKDGSR